MRQWKQYAYTHIHTHTHTETGKYMDISDIADVHKKCHATRQIRNEEVKYQTWRYIGITRIKQLANFERVVQMDSTWFPNIAGVKKDQARNDK